MRMSEVCTHENIKTCVKKIAKKEGFKNFTVSIKRLVSDVANFTGEIYYVDVNEDNKVTLHLFSKASSATKEMRAVLLTEQIYEREHFVYTTLAVVFQDIQSKHNVPKEKQFIFPKYFGSSLTEMGELLILENLSINGYNGYDRMKSITWEYAKKALEEIAKFHALSFALKKEDINKFYEMVELVPNIIYNTKLDTIKYRIEMMKNMVSVHTKLVQEEYKNKLENYVITNIDSFMKKQHQVDSKYCVFAHVDYRISNIMHKVQDNTIIDLKPVDYQCLAYGHPLNDIIYFLFTGSDEDFRRLNVGKYFEFYYESLDNFLKLLSLDVKSVYPKLQYYSDIKEKLSYGLETALFTLSCILIDPDEVLSVEEFISSGTSVKYKPNQMYIERLNGIVRDFVRWGFFDDPSNPNWERD